MSKTTTFQWTLRDTGMLQRGRDQAYNELVLALDSLLTGIGGDADLVAIAALAGTGIAVRTAANTWALRTTTAPAAGLTITNPAGIAGNITFALANDLAALEGLGSTGIAVRTAADTWAQRQVVQPAAGITVTNPAGVAGDITLALANDLAALEGMAGTGLVTRTAADTYAQRTLTAPAAGITITNPAGIAGNPTFALANDLAGVEGLAANGIAARTAADTWAVRTMTGTANKITVTNGDGVAGNPTFTIPDAVTLVTPTITGLVTLSGGQIAFPATQVPSAGANTLDDYEEGTFTPAMTFGGAAVGMTFSTASGVYTKIGRLVWTQVTMQLSAKGSSTGAAVLTGWPFSNAVQGQTPTTFAGYANWAALTSCPFGTLTTTSVAMFDFAAASQTAVDDTNFTATSVWRATVTYGAS